MGNSPTGTKQAKTGNSGQFQSGDARINRAGRPLANRDTGNTLDDLRVKNEVSIAKLAPERNAPVYSLGDPMMQMKPAFVRLMLTHSLYGAWTRLQWVNQHAEILDGDVLALIERCLSPLTSMSFSVRTKDVGDDTKPGLEPALMAKIKARRKLAQDQDEALTEHYGNISGIPEAVRHLALAKFRAYAHVKIQYKKDDKIELVPMPQLNFIRNGTNGAWLWNPKAIMTFPQDTGNLQQIVDSEFLIRTKERSLAWIIAIKFIRSNFIEKAWDQFCDVVSKLGKIIIAPQDIGLNSTEGATLQSIASLMAQGAGGVLPFGSSSEDTVRNTGQIPFKDRANWLRESLVLAGTSGQLSMLTQSGSGTLAGGAHSDTFDFLAAQEAEDISGIFQRTIDKPFLDEHFPDQPHLAFWSLNHEAEASTSEVLEDAAKARSAGFQMDAEQISEKTGYRLTVAAPPDPMGMMGGPGAGPQAGGPGGKGPEGEKKPETETPAEEPAKPEPEEEAEEVKNRDALANRAADTLGIPREWMASVRSVLQELQDKAADQSLSNAEFAAYAERLAKNAPELFRGMDHDALAEVLFAGMETGLIEGVRQTKRLALQNADFEEAEHPRDATGKFADKGGCDLSAMTVSEFAKTSAFKKQSDAMFDAASVAGRGSKDLSHLDPLTQHRIAVQLAVKAGKTVRPEVLKEYADAGEAWAKPTSQSSDEAVIAQHRADPVREAALQTKITGRLAALKPIDRDNYQATMKLDSPEATAMLKELNLTREQAMEKITDARRIVASTKQTRDQHTIVGTHGKYTPEREAVHQRIMDEMTRTMVPTEHPTLFLTGGLAGSGKSTMMKEPQYAGYGDKFVIIDSDNIKAMLAKADGIANVGSKAATYHVESSEVVYKVLHKAVSNHASVGLDGTMKSQVKVERLVALFKRNGYKVESAFTELPARKAMERATGRFLAGGRFVDPLFIAENDHKNIGTMRSLKDVSDTWRIWNTDVTRGTSPKLVEEKA